jgi:uncharacterized Zn-binding protein involved in type VI secretion
MQHQTKVRTKLVDGMLEVLGPVCKGGESVVMVAMNEWSKPLAIELGTATGADFACIGRDFDGQMTMSGFESELVEGKRVVLVGDLVSHVNLLVRSQTFLLCFSADPVVAVCVLDRGCERKSGVVNLLSLAHLDAEEFEPAQCPMCKRHMPLVRPR